MDYTVCVVEDEKFSRKMTIELLKKMDCEVRFNDIKRSLQNLALLDEGNTICQKDVY